jgi:hypothetical protein
VGVVSDEVRSLVFHQVQEASVVVWFDPKDTMPDTQWPRDARFVRPGPARPPSAGCTQHSALLEPGRREFECTAVLGDRSHDGVRSPTGYLRFYLKCHLHRGTD